MAKIRRAGLALQPGNDAGDLLVWDGIRWGPAPPPALPAPIPPAPGTITNNTTIVYVDGNPTPSSLLSPLALACLGRWESDFGIGVADGAPVPSWAPADGAFSLLNPGGVVGAPIFRREDLGDNIPYVDFDGVSNGLGQFGNFPAPYVGTDLTLYLVARSFLGQGTGTPMMLALTRLGFIPGNGAGSFCWRAFVPGPVSQAAAILNVGVAQSPGGGAIHSATWTTYVVRVATIGARQYMSVWMGGWEGRGLDLTALGGFVWAADGVSVGYNGDGPVFGGNFHQVHIRHLSIYQTAHRDDQVQYMRAYLSRYGQPF